MAARRRTKGKDYPGALRIRWSPINQRWFVLWGDDLGSAAVLERFDRFEDAEAYVERYLLRPEFGRHRRTPHTLNDPARERAEDKRLVGEFPMERGLTFKRAATAEAYAALLEKNGYRHRRGDSALQVIAWIPPLTFAEQRKFGVRDEDDLVEKFSDEAVRITLLDFVATRPGDPKRYPFRASSLEHAREHARKHLGPDASAEPARATRDPARKRRRRRDPAPPPESGTQLRTERPFRTRNYKGVTFYPFVLTYVTDDGERRRAVLYAPDQSSTNRVIRRFFDARDVVLLPGAPVRGRWLPVRKGRRR